MILHALYDYYQRKPDLPRKGFELKEVPFIIELNCNGSVVQIEDARYADGKKKRAKSFLLPQAEKKSVNVAANLLWGNAEYVLALPNKKKLEERKAKGKEKEYRARLKDMHGTFVGKITALPKQAQTDDGIRAVTRFLKDLDIKVLKRFEGVWKEIEETSPNLSFRLKGGLALVCQRPAVVAAMKAEIGEGNADGFCLVTGELDEIERLHPAIKSVWGAQTSGANIVSFNLDAFNSYGKGQGNNAPIGKRAAFAYTTALNHLLRKGSTQRLQVGDASTVFWADKPTELETGIVDIFGEPKKDDPDSNVRAVSSLYKSMDNGLMEKDEGKTRFFVLGLAPNAARIAIRFWHNATVAEMAARIRQHFDDLAIERAKFDPPYPTLFRLLVAVATQSKADNIPPNLGGELMRSILAGVPYPQTLLAAAVRRIRAEHEVTYPRAALIKACINRATRYSNPNIKEELKVSLDESNTNVGYRLGRLFAVLEKIQEESSPGINATIRDRFYGAASSTPVTVFSTLLKLKNHHIAKLDNRGRAVNLEKRIGEIMDGIGDFPAQLPLADQGRFAIGYYHQRQDFFKKHDTSTEGA
jgi:CRISPR-associated protein Csd1